MPPQIADNEGTPYETLWQRIKRQYAADPDRGVHVLAETLFNAHHGSRGRGLPAFSDADQTRWIERAKNALNGSVLGCEATTAPLRPDDRPFHGESYK